MNVIGASCGYGYTGIMGAPRFAAEPDPAEPVGRQRGGERKINNILSRMEAERFAKILRLSTVFGRMAKSAKKSEIQTEFCLDGLILQNGARGIDIRAKNGV